MAYRDYMKRVAKAIVESLGSSVSDKQIESDVENVAIFESRLASVRYLLTLKIWYRYVILF